MKTYFLLLGMLVSVSLSAQTLDEYFVIAAQNNPGLAAQYTLFEAALQKMPQVNALPEPTLSFGYFISAVETRVGPQRARISLSQMFPWFGTLKAQGDMAAALADAQMSVFEELRNKLYFQLASAYYPLYELNSWQLAESENIRILQSYKSLATTRFENGKGGLADVLRIDLQIQESETNLRILKAKEKALTAAFNALLNRPSEEPVHTPDSLSIFPRLLENQQAEILAKSPAMKALDARASAYQSAEIVAQKQAMPKIGVGLDYIVVGPRTDMTVPQSGKDALVPMISVSIPIWQQKYQAARQEARLMEDYYTLEKESLAHELVATYEMTVYEMEQQQYLVHLYEQQLTTSGQVLDLLITSYSTSGSDFEEILRIQKQRILYSKQKASALAQYQIDLAQLDYLTAYIK